MHPRRVTSSQRDARSKLGQTGGLEHGFYDFPYIGNFTLPTDEVTFFQRVRYTTSKVTPSTDSVTGLLENAPSTNRGLIDLICWKMASHMFYICFIHVIYIYMYMVLNAYIVSCNGYILSDFFVLLGAANES